MIAESTRRLLGGAFELKAAGAAGPERLRRAGSRAGRSLREAQNVSRFEASRSQGMTPFVGREHEVALLLDRWREASEGEGQVALISGEAGIGKSRILAALREQIGDAPHVRMRYQCSPHHVNDAFYPITSQISHAARFASGEPAAARLGQVGGDDRAFGVGGEGRCASPRLAAVDPRRRSISPARNGARRAKGAHDRGADRAIRGAGERRPGPGAAGGCALDRPDLARRVQPAH